MTMGCAKGVGPEIAVSAASKLSDTHDITLYGNKAIFLKAAKSLKMEIKAKIVDIFAPTDNLENLSESDCGVLSFQTLNVATESILGGMHDALVTCPINKLHWRKAGLPHIGHTEYLAHKTGMEKYAMMMASPRLRVTLATIHEAIRNVSENLSIEKIITSTTLTHKTLVKYFGIEKPKIALCALNPHCGDGGVMGNEEDKVIRPAIESLKKDGLLVYGPFSADSVFAQAVEGKYDAVIAMYHDQGLAAVKTLDYKTTINITLGLPIIRTSVDHGTAEDIAWKGIADDSNLISAVEMAVNMSRRFHA